MLSANFIQKRTAAASRGFLATAQRSCFSFVSIVSEFLMRTLCTIAIKLKLRQKFSEEFKIIIAEYKSQCSTLVRNTVVRVV